MEQQKSEFIAEIEEEITKRSRLQNIYSWTRIVLMLVIAICGFFTASSATIGGLEWLSTPKMLFVFGFISFVCASLNQYLSPSTMRIFHQNIRKSMEFIKSEVQFSGMDLSEASKYKSIAIIEPDIVLGKLKEIFEKNKAILAENKGK